MSPTLRLWSHSISMFRGAVLRPMAVKHQQAIQNSPRSVLPSSFTSNIFCTSAVLSVYKDHKPGRLRRHAESVNNKVATMRRIGERMMAADKVPRGYELVYRLKLDWYINPVKWASFIGQCALLVFLPLNVYQVRSGTMGIGTIQSEHWEFLLIFGILGAHCLAGSWISTSYPQRIYYNERKEDFIMITNSLLPWKSNQISLNEGDIVQAPTRSDTMNLNSWKHLVAANSKRLLLHRDHFQSDWFYRKLLGTHYEASNEAPSRRRD